MPAIGEEHGDQESPCPQLSEQELTKRGEGGCSGSHVQTEREQPQVHCPVCGTLWLLLSFLFSRGLYGTSCAQALF